MTVLTLASGSASGADEDLGRGCFLGSNGSTGTSSWCKALSAFPCLRLAREAGQAGGTAPCTLNAANEVAVHAFLAGRLAFSDIPAVIDQTLASIEVGHLHSFESLTATDGRARTVASELVVRRGPR